MAEGTPPSWWQPRVMGPVVYGAAGEGHPAPPQAPQAPQQHVSASAPAGWPDPEASAAAAPLLEATVGDRAAEYSRRAEAEVQLQQQRKEQEAAARSKGLA